MCNVLINLVCVKREEVEREGGREEESFFQWCSCYVQLNKAPRFKGDAGCGK